jgi:hypothetical protein
MIALLEGFYTGHHPQRRNHPEVLSDLMAVGGILTRDGVPAEEHDA